MCDHLKQYAGVPGQLVRVKPLCLIGQLAGFRHGMAAGMECALNVIKIDQGIEQQGGCCRKQYCADVRT